MTYSSQFPNVTKIDVLDIDAHLPDVTIVGDLTDMPHVPSDTYDCAIVTRVFQYLRDVPSALRELHRVLAPGGVLLCAHSGVPGRLTQTEPFENEFATLSPGGTTTLFAEAFGSDNVAIDTWGNVMACMAFLRGVSAEELGERRLLTRDPFFPQTITVRAVKPMGTSPNGPARQVD
jgi:SAM-dependent methyltransferase